MGTTVGVVLISYDVNKSHTEVKDAMKVMGYFDNWHIGNGPNYNLPNTTVWHKTKSTDQAIADINSVCTSLRVTLEKAIAVLANEFAGA
jgi:hypothetical protein